MRNISDNPNFSEHLDRGINLKSKMPISRIPIAVKSKESSNESKPDRNLLRKPVLKAPVASSHQSGGLHVLKKQSSSRLVKSSNIHNNKLKKNVKCEESRELSGKTNEKSNICKNDKPPSLSGNVISDTHKDKDFSSIKMSVKSCSAKEKGVPLLKTCIKSVDTKEKYSSLMTTKNSSRSRIKNISLKNNVKSTNSNTDKGKGSFVNTTQEFDNSLKELTPKIVVGKENKALSKPSWFLDQKDIKFEANDALKKLILRNREPSPSLSAPGFRFSSIQSQRPSIYQPMDIPTDPFKEAMRAIENAVAKRGRNAEKLLPETLPSPFKVDRPSFYSPRVDPKKEVMESLKKLKNQQLKSSIKVDRPSFYTCVDPKKEVMESLKKLKLKQQQKSSKKVTFNLNIEECMTEHICDPEPNSFKASDGKLSQLVEKSQGNTPHSQKTVSISKKDQDDSSRSEFKKQEDFIKDEEVETIKEIDSDAKDKCTNFYESSVFCTPINKSACVMPVVKSGKLSSVQHKELEIKNYKKTIPIKEIDIAVKDKCVNFYEKAAFSTPLNKSVFSTPIMKYEKLSSVQQNELAFQNCFKTSISHQMFESKDTKDRNSKTQPAVFITPRPISISSRSKLLDSCSPEYFVKGTPESLLKSAPICTPLVLKSVAKSAMLSPDNSLSPVRLKLDFSEKDAPKKETSTSFKLFNCKNITTAQNKLDELADQECCKWLSGQNGPVICGRYIENPVSKVLEEGDEMHFIPIKF